ncbi:MAG: SdrD B-like domain-containing protein, partial [archaeon]
MKQYKTIYILILLLAIILPVKTLYAESTIPSGYQSFYVLGNSTMIVHEAVDEAFGLDTETAVPSSIFSLVSYQDDTTIYIDQKGNGYGFNQLTFTGADAVFQLDKGGVITFNKDTPPYYNIIPPGSGTLVSGTLNNPGENRTGIDGGDYFFVAGGPLTVFRGVTDARTSLGDGNYVAGMWELYSVEEGGEDSQKQYIIPCGENTSITEDFQGPPEGNGGTFAVVQSTADDTLVEYSQKGVPGNKLLQRGDSFVIPHVNENDYINANNKIQVGLIASGGEVFDIRYFTLPDSRFTGYDYWIPLFPSGSTPMNVRYHVHAITNASVTIEKNGGIEPGWNGRSIVAGSTDASYLTDGTHPVHIYAESDEKIIVLVTVDAGSGDRDWGYTALDSSALIFEYFLPYAPSGRSSNSDMQLWVMGIFEGTTVFADYNQDGVVDDSVVLSKYESHGFYDSDMDNTGTELFSDFPFTAVYGESSTAEIAGLSTAGYDWGYTIIPLNILEANLVLELDKSVTPKTVSNQGIVNFTIQVHAGDNDFGLQFNWINDTLPEGFTYCPDTSVITHTDNSVTYENPVINGTHLAWSFDEIMLPNENVTIEFCAYPSETPGEKYINLAIAEGVDPFGNIYRPEGRAFITVSDKGVVLGNIYDVTCGGSTGVPDITVELYNCSDPGNMTLVNTTVTDANGYYDFTEISNGTYCVTYDYLDPDMGLRVPHSDDDPLLPPSNPLTSSAEFNLGINNTYIHNFMIITPVDLYIEKTGPNYAFAGDNITYMYTVGNNGFTGAKNIVLMDDICGTPTYVTGDTNLNNILDPPEEWVYNCSHTVTSPPGLLVNTVNVSTTSRELYPDDNEDNWTTIILDLDIEVNKSLIIPPSGVTYVGETVVFTVNITNTGTSTFETVPLLDTYDSGKLEYDSATIPEDILDEGAGEVIWFDLTGGGSLAPMESIVLNITFTAIDSTSPDETVNTASVVDAKIEGFDEFASDSDSDEIMILEPDILVEKTCVSHPTKTVDIGEQVIFNITISNNGDAAIVTLPLKDTYDSVYLEYVSAIPLPDNVDNNTGVLEWLDLTGAGSLAPGESTTVTIVFEAIDWTDGVTVD